MLKIIEDMPPGTIGFEASGKISDDDYRDVLVPAVKTALEAGGVRLLYVLADGTSYSPGAVWADTKLWAGNLRGWKRVAGLRRRLARECRQGFRLDDAGRGEGLRRRRRRR